MADTGALDRLKTNRTALAIWITRTLREQVFSSESGSNSRIPKLIDAVRFAGDTLAGMTVPMDPRKLDIDLLDALSAGNVAWTASAGNWLYNWSNRWDSWRDDDNYADSETQRWDLAGITQHPQLQEWPFEIIAAAWLERYVEVLSTVEYGKELVRRWFDCFMEVRKAVTGSASQWERLKENRLRFLAKPRLAELYPEEVERAFHFDPAEELQARLHIITYEQATELLKTPMTTTIKRFCGADQYLFTTISDTIKSVQELAAWLAETHASIPAPDPRPNPNQKHPQHESSAPTQNNY